jgi:hypothetical protein
VHIVSSLFPNESHHNGTADMRFLPGQTCQIDHRLPNGVHNVRRSIGNLFGAATLLWRGQYERTPGTERFNFAGQVT